MGGVGATHGLKNDLISEYLDKYYDSKILKLFLRSESGTSEVLESPMTSEAKQCEATSDGGSSSAALAASYIHLHINTTLTCFSPDPLSLTLSLMLDYDAHDSVQTSQTKYLKFKIA